MHCMQIITGKTLGKLPWKSRVPLQRNGMAAIPKKIELDVKTAKIPMHYKPIEIQNQIIS